MSRKFRKLVLPVLAAAVLTILIVSQLTAESDTEVDTSGPSSVSVSTTDGHVLVNWSPGTSTDGLFQVVKYYNKNVIPVFWHRTSTSDDSQGIHYAEPERLPGA